MDIRKKNQGGSESEVGGKLTNARTELNTRLGNGWGRKIKTER